MKPQVLTEKSRDSVQNHSWKTSREKLSKLGSAIVSIPDTPEASSSASAASTSVNPLNQLLRSTPSLINLFRSLKTSKHHLLSGKARKLKVCILPLFVSLNPLTFTQIKWTFKTTCYQLLLQTRICTSPPPHWSKNDVREKPLLSIPLIIL